MTGSAPLDLLLLCVPVLLARLWWTGSQAKELAIAHARQACHQRRLQFLDQTVALRTMRLCRTAQGGTCVRREYQFEFTDQGEFRDAAQLTMEGHKLKNLLFSYTRDADGHRVYVQ